MKTPVTSMRVFADVVHESLVESDNRELADLKGKMNKQLDRLTKRINHLHDTTRISEGQIKLDKEAFDLNA